MTSLQSVSNSSLKDKDEMGVTEATKTSYVAPMNNDDRRTEDAIKHDTCRLDSSTAEMQTEPGHTDMNNVQTKFVISSVKNIETEVKSETGISVEACSAKTGILSIFSYFHHLHVQMPCKINQRQLN